MANVHHFNKQSVRNVIKEHIRDTDHYKNDVDVSRTGLNFGYGHQSADDMALNIKDRCNDIMQGNRMQEQTNVMSEWKVTYPSWLCDKVKGQNGKNYNKPRNEEHVKLFFNTVYDFTVKRYGSENVMGAYVHMDETTPHIHIDLVPEAVSRKTGRKTVSSASLFSRSELKNYQRDLQKEMIRVFGKDAGAYILNGRTKGNYSIDELKERTRVNNRQKKREKLLNDREAAITLREQDDTKFRRGFRDMVSDITGHAYPDDYDNLSGMVDDLQRWLQEKERQINDNIRESRDIVGHSRILLKNTEKFCKSMSEQYVEYMDEQQRQIDEQQKQIDAMSRMRRQDKLMQRRYDADGLLEDLTDRYDKQYQ